MADSHFLDLRSVLLGWPMTETVLYSKQCVATGRALEANTMHAGGTGAGGTGEFCGAGGRLGEDPERRRGPCGLWQAET